MHPYSAKDLLLVYIKAALTWWVKRMEMDDDEYIIMIIVMSL